MNPFTQYMTCLCSPSPHQQKFENVVFVQTWSLQSDFRFHIATCGKKKWIVPCYGSCTMRMHFQRGNPENDVTGQSRKGSSSWGPAGKFLQDVLRNWSRLFTNILYSAVASVHSGGGGDPQSMQNMWHSVFVSVFFSAQHLICYFIVINSESVFSISKTDCCNVEYTGGTLAFWHLQRSNWKSHSVPNI